MVEGAKIGRRYEPVRTGECTDRSGRTSTVQHPGLVHSSGCSTLVPPDERTRATLVCRSNKSLRTSGATSVGRSERSLRASFCASTGMKWRATSPHHSGKVALIRQVRATCWCRSGKSLPTLCSSNDHLYTSFELQTSPRTPCGTPVPNRDSCMQNAT
ncbi:hypothetical protein F2Q69_00039157 [Brassica cretica]|uniref:Uncharacterized protein n=1 Tax=Brassica cretica TaxID=69181 RepID=A0A8S9SAE9_BRACR|nr:hypothetical protein F2Q69_00039157 [Brassica cretica]